MIRFEFEDEIFYYVRGRFTDEHFMTLNETKQKQVSNFYFGTVDYKSMCMEALFEFIKETKNANAIYITKDACEHFLQTFNDRSYIKQILPLLSSSYRLMHLPEKAADLENDYPFSIYGTTAYCTSVAAAYCDLREYNIALKIVKKVNAMHGNFNGEKTELSVVYDRIRKESGLE